MMLLAPILSLLAMGLIAAWGHRNIAPGRRHLPMQWSSNGTATWQAPRVVALAAIPVAIAGAMVLVAYLSRDNPADRDTALVWISIIAPGIAAFHQGLVARAIENEE